MKLDKIEREMQKTREKISDLQNKLKELEAQKTEQENLQIIQTVRAFRVSPQELKAFLSGDYYPDVPQTEAEPVTDPGYYDTAQEVGADEE